MDDDALEASLADLASVDVAELLAGATTPAQEGARQEGFTFAPCSYSLHPGLGEKWVAATSSLGRGFSLHVTAEKLPAQFGANGTFRWHKNCVLPRLRIVASGGDAGALEGAAVLLSAVTVDVLTHTARSVGLEGVTLRPLVNHACSFSSLSFTTTSYNLPGRPSIHLMASLLCLSAVPPTITLADPANPHATGAGGAAGKRHVIACSSISPALTVDARKRQAKSKGEGGSAVSGGNGGVTASAGSENHEGTAAAEGGSTGGAGATGGAARPPLLPFAPDLLERRLEKVGGKAGQEAARTHIDNSMEGLRAYLSALNIRHKCRHPLFLVLRFNACVRLLYDAAREANPAEDDDAFFRMMRNLDRAVGGGGGESGLASTGAPGAFAPFVVAIKDEHDATACEHTHCPVRLCTTLSLPHAASLPPTYQMLSDLQTLALRRTYCRLHCSHGGMGGIARGPIASLNARSSQQPGYSQQCTTCLVPHQRLPTPLPIDAVGAAAQRSASTLLASLNEMTAASSDLFDGCPEFEWSHGLRALAEAMSMHCRTRSAAEIVAFMHDEAVGREKRHVNNNRSPDREVSLASGANSDGLGGGTADGVTAGGGVATLAEWNDGGWSGEWSGELNASSWQTPQPQEAFEHSHSVPTMCCDRECEDAVMEGGSHSHQHSPGHSSTHQTSTQQQVREVDGFWS